MHIKNEIHDGESIQNKVELVPCLLLGMSLIPFSTHMATPVRIAEGGGGAYLVAELLAGIVVV